MDSYYILGMDVGTSSIKASLWDVDNDKVIMQSTVDYHISFDTYGRIRQNPNDIYNALLMLLEDVVVNLDEQSNNKKFMTILVDTALHTLLLLDEKMCPISDVIPWMDSRADSVALELLQSGRNAEIHGRTGCPIDSVYPLYKIIWYARNHGDLLKKAGKISSIKDFLLYKLTGQFVLDFSTASGSGCLDIHSLDWVDDILSEMAGVNSSKFPSLVSPYKVFDLTNDMKNFFKGHNITANLAVGISDAAASSVATTCFDLNVITISMGTSAAIRKISPKPFKANKAPSDGIWCYIVDEDYYIIGMAMRSGGCVIDWWRKNFLKLDDYSHILEAIKSIMHTSFDQVYSAEPIFIPTVYGERVPRWMPNRNGGFVGLTGAIAINEATQSVVKGVGFNLRRIFEVIVNYFGIEETKLYDVVATGGMCQIQDWLAFLSSVLNHKMVARGSRYDTSLGLIMFYLREKAPSLFKLMVKNSKDIYPQQSLCGALELSYQKWLQEMECVETRLLDLYNIRN